MYVCSGIDRRETLHDRVVPYNGFLHFWWRYLKVSKLGGGGKMFFLDNFPST